jgi:hypothetical protein
MNTVMAIVVGIIGLASFDTWGNVVIRAGIHAAVALIAFKKVQR